MKATPRLAAPSLAIASTSLLATSMAHGAIVWSGTLSNSVAVTGTYTMDLNSDLVLDYTVFFDGNGTPNQTKPVISSGPGRSSNPNAWVLAKTNSGEPVTAFATMIDAGYAATFPQNKNGYLWQDHDANTPGEWPFGQNTEGYVGLELTDNSSTTNFAWVHFAYQGADSPVTLTVIDYAYETTSGKGIPAGMVSYTPHIYKQPQPQTVGAGTAAQFKVVALADPAPGYRWKAGAVGSGVYTNLPENSHFSGTTTPTLTINTATPSDVLDYVVVVTNALGAVTSTPAKLSVPVAILAGPTPTQPRLYEGITGHLNIGVVSGVPTGFQWRKNGGIVSNGTKYAGATTSNLLINTLAPGDAGNYDVIVTTPYGSITSSITPLVVVPRENLYVRTALDLGPVVYYGLNETTDPAATNVVTYENAYGLNGIYGPDVWNGNTNYNIAGPTPADGFPGLSSTNRAIETFINDINSVVTLPGWNLNTNSVTITAWINPQGDQAGGAAIVYTRSTNNMVCGIGYYTGFLQGNYKLGYNWNDQPGDYFWNSGLDVPQGQWSFIALVITPTDGTMYVMNANGISSAVNGVGNAVQSWNDKIYIGTDPQGTTGGNNFNGMIDEVAVYNYSMTPTQVQALYAAALGQPYVQIQPVSGGLQVKWAFGTLQEADSLQGPWTTKNVASPYLIAPTAPQKFYRAVAP